MKVISLGWGVQSFTLAAMVALGELEPVDVAIHADTTHDSVLTYAYVKKWTPWLGERGVRVATVNDAPKELINEWGGILIPAYTDLENEGGGMIHRQCTGNWKIAPMRRWLQANRNGERIEQWLGISLDEFQRMKPSNVKYIEHRWPLIELKMTRHDCKMWLDSHGIEIPPRSSCVFCPFHSTKEWRNTRDVPEDWTKAVEVDGQIRKARPPYDLYVCNQRRPLIECDFDSPQDKGQLDLWNEECSGYCGV